MGGFLGGGFGAQSYRAQAGVNQMIVGNLTTVQRIIIAATPFPAAEFTAASESWRVASGGHYTPGGNKAAAVIEGWFNRQTAGGAVTSTQVFTAPTTFALANATQYGVRVDGHNVWSTQSGTNFLSFNTRFTIFAQVAGTVLYDAMAGTNVSAGIPQAVENWNFVWVINTGGTTVDGVTLPYNAPIATMDNVNQYRDVNVACGVSEFLNVARNFL